MYVYSNENTATGSSKRRTTTTTKNRSAESRQRAGGEHEKDVADVPEVISSVVFLSLSPIDKYGRLWKGNDRQKIPGSRSATFAFSTIISPGISVEKAKSKVTINVNLDIYDG